MNILDTISSDNMTQVTHLWYKINDIIWHLFLAYMTWHYWLSSMLITWHDIIVWPTYDLSITCHAMWNYSLSLSYQAVGVHCAEGMGRTMTWGIGRLSGATCASFSLEFLTFLVWHSCINCVLFLSNSDLQEIMKCSSSPPWSIRPCSNFWNWIPQDCRRRRRSKRIHPIFQIFFEDSSKKKT